MIKKYFAATSLVALLASAPALAQHSGHGGMNMPMPMTTPTTPPAAKKKPVPATPPAMDHGAMDMPMPNAPVAPAPVDHNQMNHGTAPADPPMTDHAAMPGMEHGAMSGMDHGAMPGADHGAMPGMDHAAMGGHAMAGAYGPYSSNCEASGTAWQPDSSEHGGLHIAAGDWTLMIHGTATLTYDWQESPRGDRKLALAGHLIAAARRQIGAGTLQLRTILSPDFVQGKRGYPLLLQTGETADGKTRLIDRQHPHDLFGELSASYSLPLSKKDSVFVYAGLPGEPAFGPPVYLHRRAIQDSVEAPITHHWLDSTHTSFGVVTAGFVHDNFKLEASRLNGREPDQHRLNIETGPLDSTAVRLSWNPTRQLALQASWAHLVEPEQLEPGVNQRRLSASALYTRKLGPDSWWAATVAWGRRTQRDTSLDAFALESGLGWKRWTLFGRGEMIENNELVPWTGQESPAYRVGKISLGLVRDFPVAEHLAFGVGGLYAVNFVPRALKDVYGSRSPRGAMGFLRLKLQ